MTVHISESGADAGIPQAELEPGMYRLIGRALCLGCPLCGRGRMFSTWFTVRERCESCAFRFQRGESDYFIGAYTLHLIVAELIVVAIMLVWMIVTWPNVPWDGMVWGILGLSIVGITATYPFSRSLWLAVDLLFRPAAADDF